jgi:cell division septal protein FtsQ
LFSHRGNYFLFSGTDFSAKLVKNFQIVSATIDKTFPDQITINVLERAPVLLLNNGGELYHLDNKGLAYEQVTEQALNNLPTLKLTEPMKITLESEPLKKELFTFIMLLQRQLINLNVPVSYYEMNTANSLVLKTQTTEKWYLLLNLQEDLDKQTQKLKVVLQNKISDRSKLEYIDLRFGDKIFYK